MGMLLSDPSAPSASQITSKSSDSASSPSPNATYNTTIPAPSPGPRLWDMNMFVYLAVPLLFGTIVMPLISGTLLRFIVKIYTHLIPWYDVACAVLWPLWLFYWEVKFLPGPVRRSVDALVVAVVIYQTYRAFLKKVRRTLFSAFSIVIVVCFILDLFLTLSVPLAGTVAWTIFLVASLRKSRLGRSIRKLFRKTRWKQTAKP